MKKTIQIMAVAILSFISVNLFAQETEPKKENAPVKQEWDAKKNPIVAEINEKYQSQLLAEKPAMTNADIFPIIGTYKSTNAEAENVTISLDAENKGLVWVEGLPHGKIKAMLRKSPATYKIPAQKTESGKDVAEGTLSFDKETNTLNVCIGKEYNSANPTEVFAATEVVTEEVPADAKNVKSKKAPNTKKAWMFTATKVETVTAMN